MIDRKQNRHLGYYLSLLGVLLLGFLLIYFVSPNRQLQILIFVVVTLFYIVLGIAHHKINHDLTAKIMVEYILIGAFGVAVMFFLFKGGLGL
jgi:hypothetical protein